MSKTVIDIISNILHTPVEDITPESDLSEDLKTDSLDYVEIIMGLEDEFIIKIPDDDYDKLRTVQDMIDYVEKNKRVWRKL